MHEVGVVFRFGDSVAHLKIWLSRSSRSQTDGTVDEIMISARTFESLVVSCMHIVVLLLSLSDIKSA